VRLGSRVRVSRSGRPGPRSEEYPPRCGGCGRLDRMVWLRPRMNEGSCCASQMVTLAPVYYWRIAMPLTPTPRYQLFVGADIAARSITLVWAAPDAPCSRPLRIEQ